MLLTISEILSGRRTVVLANGAAVDGYAVDFSCSRAAGPALLVSSRPRSELVDLLAANGGLMRVAVGYQKLSEIGIESAGDSYLTGNQRNASSFRAKGDVSVDFTGDLALHAAGFVFGLPRIRPVDLPQAGQMLTCTIEGLVLFP